MLFAVHGEITRCMDLPKSYSQPGIWLSSQSPVSGDKMSHAPCLPKSYVCSRVGLKKLLDRMMFRTSTTMLEQLNSSVSNLCWSNLTGSSMYDFSPTPTYPTF